MVQRAAEPDRFSDSGANVLFTLGACVPSSVGRHGRTRVLVLAGRCRAVCPRVLRDWALGLHMGWTRLRLPQIDARIMALKSLTEPKVLRWMA